MSCALPELVLLFLQYALFSSLPRALNLVLPLHILFVFKALAHILPPSWHFPRSLGPPKLPALLNQHFIKNYLGAFFLYWYILLTFHGYDVVVSKIRLQNS